MTEPTIKHRLAGLRERLSDLVWDAAFPGKETKITEEDLACVAREIKRLEEYERLGYEHEPNF